MVWMVLLGSTAPFAGAAEPTGGISQGSDDLLSGFDAPGPTTKGAVEEDLSAGFSGNLPSPKEADDNPEPAGTAKPSLITLNGYLREGVSFNYTRQGIGPGAADFQGLNRLRTTLRLESTLHLGAGWKAFLSGQAFYDVAYGLKGTENYDQGVLDAYQQEAEVREAYLSGSLGRSLDIKIGRQIVVWGKSDNIRVVDVLNPLDFREPGLTDLEDIRLPLAMTRVDYYLGKWSLQAVAVHEVRFNKLPPANSEFSPLTTTVPEDIPPSGGDNTEYGLSLGATFSGWDFALYWADVFNDWFWADVTGFPVMTARHSRVKMTGAGANLATGAWLWKMEAAQLSGLDFSWFNPAPPATASQQLDRMDVLLGFDYSGIQDTTLSLEVVSRQYQNFNPALEAAPNYLSEQQKQAILSYRGSFLREKLNLAAVFSSFDAQGGFQRYQAAYELATAMILTGGVVIYDGGDGSDPGLAAFEDNDRLFLDLKWAF